MSIYRSNFQVVDYGIARDRSGFWVFNRNMGKNGRVIKALGNMYYQVDNSIYYFEDLVQGAEVTSFEALPRDYFARDAFQYLYRGCSIDVPTN